MKPLANVTITVARKDYLAPNTATMKQMATATLIIVLNTDGTEYARVTRSVRKT